MEAVTCWTDSDVLNAREALIVGGPSDGLRILVSDGKKGLRYPDVIDLSGYVFDRGTWEFRDCGCAHGCERPTHPDCRL